MREQIRNIYSGNRNLLLNVRKSIKKSYLSDSNKEILLKFENHLFAKNNCESRVAKLLSQLKKILERTKIQLNVINKQNIEDVLAEINKDNIWKESTKTDYKRVIKQVLFFLGKVDLAKDIKINRKYRKQIRFNDIISDDEIKVILKKGCKSDKERAFIMLLHETGARIEEFLNIKIKDIHKGEAYCRIRVYGKTGERFVPVIASIPYLFSWLSHHPERENPNAYLWLTESPNYYGKPLIYIGAVKLIKRCFHRSEMDYKIKNPHHFRHSRATLNAEWMTETQLCLYMGWTIGSNMPRTYVHASSKQLIDTVLQKHGIKKEEDLKPKNTPKNCNICSHVNESIADFCSKCGNPLSLEIAISSEQKFNQELNKTVKVMMELMKNEEEWKKFKESISFKNCLR